MNIFDYPHIAKAIQNVSNDLKYKGKACVIATMGIGKSAIATSIMLDYSDKRILFCAPRNLLLDQIRGHLKNMGHDLDKDFFDLQFCTYAQLHSMIKRGIIPNFDLFICDEFHAIAKKKQYNSIKQLFTDDEDKRYLGLSATPILQWEYEVVNNENNKKEKRRVNMASVLYDDNVSFFYSLDDAFSNGLFPVPIYNEFFVLYGNIREEAEAILRQKVGDNFTESQLNSLMTYLDKEAGLVSILKKYLNLKNTKIMFYCRDFKDLLDKERLLKKEFPNLDIYKTSCRLKSKENEREIEQFRSNEFRNENSKVLLSIRQMTEGFHTDGEMQLVFANKTKAYRDFLQKFGRGCSLGNTIPVKILDLGGNLTRISSLDFLRFRTTLAKDGVSKESIPSLPKITFGGNIVDLNNYIESICQTNFVSNREKADIYYERIVSNGGYLKNSREQFKDGVYLKDWYKEMLKMAKDELRLYKDNSEYEISSDNMYVIETLAHIDNYLKGIVVPTVQDKRKLYYEKALEYGNFLPKGEEYRFTDGTYMSTWYNEQNKRVKEILRQLETIDDYSLSDKNFELIKWFRDLHIGIKDSWLDKHLGLQKDLMDGETYTNWKIFSEVANKDSKLLKTKKLCEGFDKFSSLDEYCSGVDERMTNFAEQSFSYSRINIDDVEKHLAKRN